ncbi:hypothetical protein D0T84_11245 [Dysgonomonas sp. 521]|uniref:hypothetical protein n=1 Tax=Dysgonomonas sp. 521 TaxID=2302932 RepID=UPI0013D423FF|nr:hypothetical protein [Dysgonomonas sp. 521]NDV95479.1 hypothetical protein [Dysgonomonas sp. 521]
MSQTTANGLLYPAMHKLYSALNSLEQFQKGNNFFDNISCLDNFFSEYRNITFVLQKSLAHTEYESIYEENRAKYLLNETCKWFVEKRNEVLKQHPFNLEKRITITLYSPQTSIALPEYVFTIENDVEYSTIIDSLRSLFIDINPVEVFFSVEFSFYEKGQNKELYDDLILGISNMKMFISSMREAINEECRLCDQLEQKIDKMNFYQVPKNMLFIEDFAYYPQKDHFEKGSRMEVMMPDLSIRMPLSGFCNFLSKDSNEKRNAFDDFITMHIVVFSMQKTLMPTFMIVYEDETFALKSFHASIKTTMYRTINDIAKRIESDKIKSIFYVTEMLKYANESNDYREILKMNSNDRAKYRTSELLCFYMLDSNLHFQSYCFDSEKIDDMGYVMSILKSQFQESTITNFLQPIKDEFERIRK